MGMAQEIMPIPTTMTMASLMKMKPAMAQIPLIPIVMMTV